MYLDHPIPVPVPSSPQPASSPPPPSPQESHDIASLRHTHTTQGYRDGITSGKSKYLQNGFDEGYALGGRFGLKLGWIKGVIEGLGFLGGAEELRRRAETELTLDRVFAREFFDEGGVWRYEVCGEGEGEGVTLDRIVEKHPLVEAWVARVKGEAGRWGLVLGEGLGVSVEVGEEEGVREEGEVEGEEERWL